MPSDRLVLFCPPLLLSSVFPSIRVFSNESLSQDGFYQRSLWACWCHSLFDLQEAFLVKYSQKVSLTLKMRNMRSLTWAGLSFPSSSSRNVCPQGTGSCCSTRDPAISCLNSKSCVCLCPTFYSDYVSSRWNELLFVQHKGKLFTNICRREFCRGDFHWLHIFTLP